MSVTIKDVLNLEIMKDFKVVAGGNGLGRRIAATEILDFEFVQEVQSYREIHFEGNSMVLTSLLFAKDKPEEVLRAIKRLVKMNVQALAYKPVFFRELPQEALAYANQMNFPILEFGRDEFFEDIIFSIKGLIEKNDTLEQAEPLIEAMISETMTPDEVEKSRERMNPLLRPLGMAVYLKSAELTEARAAELIRRGCPDEKLKSKTFVGKHHSGIVVFLSQDEENPSRFKALLDDVLIAYGLAGKALVRGFSDILPVASQFDRCIREAYWAEKVAEIEGADEKKYRELGVYKLITSTMQACSTADYMNEYLAPIFEEEGQEGELLHTAVEYIMAKGDMAKTAERLYCHKNTIRYRIGKLQEKLDPTAGEKEFYENLSAAIKIYLLSH